MITSPSPHRLAVSSFLVAQRDQLAARPRILRASRAGALPASHAQRRIWFVERLGATRSLHTIPLAWRLEGHLDRRALERAFAELVRRHESLRTVFAEEGGEPVQIILPPSPFTLEVEAARGAPADAIARALEDNAGLGLDLARGPLFRVRLVELGPDAHVLLLALHHIIADGGSVRVLRSELSALYRAFLRGEPSPLRALDVQYADFAAWQRSHGSDAALEPQVVHFEQALRGMPETLDLVPDHPSPAVQSFRGKTAYFELDAELTGEVRRLARAHEATTYMVFLAAYAALLARRSGQVDFAIGSPIASRVSPELEPLVGCLINSLALRVRPEPHLTFAEHLGRVRRTALAAYENQEAPFERLVERLRPARSPAHAPLFQTMLIRHPPRNELALEGLVVEALDHASPTSKLDLTLSVQELNGRTRAHFEYNADLFEPETIARLGEELVVLLSGVVRDPMKRLFELPLLAPAEHALIEAVNHTRTAFPADATVHGLFEAQAAATSERVAASSGGASLTYRALDARADALARGISSRGLGRGALVGILLERGLDALAALLGVLKAGCAYVPLDPEYPAARLERMLEGVELVVTSAALAAELPPGAPGRPLLVEAPDAADRAEAAEAGPVDADAVAYVLHTSGSTGRPKGVVIRHRSVVNLLAAMRDVVRLGADDVLLSVTTLSFDIAALELFLPLVSGARVEIAPRAVAIDGRALASVLASSRATVMQATPSTWRMLLGAGADLSALTILTGGEALPPELALELCRRGRRVLNLYGPTETTIWSTFAELDRAALEAGAPVTIGRPIANTDVWVLGPNLERMPLGAAGELYIGGEGLARGYLAAPEQTARAFVPRPPACRPVEGASEHLYRTGDRVRLGADGRLEFLGRTDRQVKLRGFRIELGEVEAALASHPSVLTAAAAVRDEGRGPILVGFVVRRSDLDAGLLREHARALLPPQMVPSMIVELPALPLTPNKKVDRAELQRVPLPEAPAPRGAEGPRDALERRLLELFEAALGGRVGVHDDFFARGGHSLSALELLARVEASFGRAPPMMTFFRGPTVAQVATTLREGAPRAARSPLEDIQPVGAQPPLFFVGSTRYARALAPHLGEDQPVYALNVFGLADEGAPPRPIVVFEVARAYLDELRRVQPRGPYRLAAFCADTKVAFELAQQLRADGEPIELLAFIDTVWVGERFAHPGVLGLVENLLHFGPEYLEVKARRRTRRFGERLTSLADAVRIRWHHLRREPLPVRLSHGILVRSYVDALGSYRGAPFDGRIVLFTSRELRRFEPSVLESLALGGLDVRELPGYHDRFFQSPQVEVLAGELRALLNPITRVL